MAGAAASRGTTALDANREEKKRNVSALFFMSIDKVLF